MNRKIYYYILILVGNCLNFCGNEEGEQQNCGNNICESDETQQSCPQDCSNIQCGNGVREGDEQCDGSDLGNKKCEDIGDYLGGILGCDSECNFSTINCTTPCGNGVIDEDEECDGIELGEKNCVTEGFKTGTLRCSQNCTLDSSQCSNMEETGGPCSKNSDCISGLCQKETTTGLPSGYCIDQCDAEGNCSSMDEICVSLGESMVCVKSCTPGQQNQCREGYKCIDFGDGSGACWSGCTDNSQCIETNKCETNSGFCVCSEGSHLETQQEMCINDTCEYLNCEQRQKNCNENGGNNNNGTYALCDSCLEETFIPAQDYCYPPDAQIGGECTELLDCPGQYLNNVSCIDTTEGFCVSINDCNEIGSQCDNLIEDSICVNGKFQGENVNLCVKSCDTDQNCRPGYFCKDFDGYKGCWIIDDCTTRGCNDINEQYYCDETAEIDLQYCWINNCSLNPCDGITNSTGDCINLKDNYICICKDSYVWNEESSICDLCDDRVVNLDKFNSDTITRTTEDSCTDGTSIYNPKPGENSCIGYPFTGKEIVYKLIVPGNTSITITNSPTSGQDVSLYVIENCNDIQTEQCTASIDESPDGEPENLLLTNSEDISKTFYIIADTFTGCGTFDLSVTLAQ